MTGKSRQGDLEGVYHNVLTVMKQTAGNADAHFISFYLSHSAQDLSHRMVLPTFRTSLPTPVNLDEASQICLFDGS